LAALDFLPESFNCLPKSFDFPFSISHFHRPSHSFLLPSFPSPFPSAHLEIAKSFRPSSKSSVLSSR
jgi:hypothetical protein